MVSQCGAITSGEYVRYTGLITCLYIYKVHVDRPYREDVGHIRSMKKVEYTSI